MCFCFTIPALAQDPDSIKTAEVVKTDTIKIDTALLNKYRIGPRQNAIPVRLRPSQIKQEEIPVTLLDYKINYWRKWVTLNVNLSQSSFSSNWSNGGISSLAFNGDLYYKTEYNKQPFSFTSELRMVYGRLSNKGQIARKTNDRLFFDNKIGTRLSKNWIFFGSVTVETQFDKGYNYPNNQLPILISSMFSPGYVTESVGFQYVPPGDIFNLRIGTGTARQTFVLDTTMYKRQPNNYGVDRGKIVKNELAFQLVAEYKKNLMQNVRLTSRYQAFLPYGRGLVANIDHRLDATITATVNRLISVTINGTAIYDKDQQPKPQYTENMGMGIVYRFP
ncbi:hypothetical protein GCM10028827_14510 [Mucilaginibacter myungsuensis]